MLTVVSAYDPEIKLVGIYIRKIDISTQKLVHKCS